MDGIAKAAQPRYEEMAIQVSNEMINEFSSKEQREMILIIQTRIEDNYNAKIAELEKDLETVHHHKQTFLGNPTDIKTYATGDRPG